MRTIPVLVCISSSLAFGQFGSMNIRQDGDMMTVKLSDPMVYSNQTLAGLPYSAEQVSEHVQTLADGTHITHPKNIRKVWRDSQGRTRTEEPLGRGFQTGENGGFVMIQILDPVGGFFYVLDNQNKVAHRLPFTTAPVPQRLATPQKASATPARPRHPSTSERLGSRNIEGVIAEGTRTTNTTPIGEVGNDRPIVSTWETWYCQELKISVLSTNSDPRNGEDTMRTTNISRTEPDPALFMPPADYTVVDEKDSFTMTLKRQN